jgi:hypothetical protein
MSYETCSDVSPEFWDQLAGADPEEITGRTGARFQDGVYRLPFMNRELMINPGERRVQVAQDPEMEAGFRVCLLSLLYLLKMEPSALGPLASPLELPGGATFFRGHHGVPSKPLEERFGQDAAGLLAAGTRLGAEPRPAGDAALSLTVFPGLTVMVVLWQGDEEFPAQASFSLPADISRFWGLDAAWGLMNLVVQELIRV